MIREHPYEDLQMDLLTMYIYEEIIGDIWRNPGGNTGPENVKDKYQI